VRVLGIDTATRRASVGVLLNGEIVAEQSQTASGSHAITVLPLIADTLQRAGCTVRDLDAIAVSCGPGTFTGLRVGLSVAKGFACATGVPVVGVPTLEALARTVSPHHGTICTVLDARKGELYAACFASESGGVRRLTPDAVVTPEALVARIVLPCVILGDALPRYEAFLREHLGSQATILPYDTHGPRGGIVATIGWERLQAGATDMAASLEPTYVRPPDAERNARREGTGPASLGAGEKTAPDLGPPGRQAPKPQL